LGIRYEGKVQEHLHGLYGDLYVPSPWFKFQRRDGIWNYAQPDGLLFDFHRGLVTIVEVKYSHTSEAYFQLIDKYVPLLRTFLPNKALWQIATCEVVNWFDKSIAYPCEIKLRKTVDLARPGEFAVHIWKPN
jgi:hypothetical protein